MARLDDLAGLTDGWDGEGSPSPTLAALSTARRVDAMLGTPVRWLGPVPGGGVQFEFEAPDKTYLEIEISPEGECSYLIDPKRSGDYEEGGVLVDDVPALVIRALGPPPAVERGPQEGP
jgi:hypothetical protein